LTTLLQVEVIANQNSEVSFSKTQYTIYVTNFRCFSDVTIVQGKVVTCLRCVVLSDYYFTAN